MQSHRHRNHQVRTCRQRLPALALLLSQLSCGWVGRESVVGYDGGNEDAGMQAPANGLDGAIHTDAMAILDADESGTPFADASSDASIPSCSAIPTTEPADPRLRLRYDFRGEGTRVVDGVGQNDGVVHGGATLDCSGSLALDGIDDYVSMPSGLISSLQSVTIMMWLVWDRLPGACTWERAFAFGSSDAGPGNPGFVESSLSLTLSTCPDRYLSGILEVETPQGIGTTYAVPNQWMHVALVIDASRDEMRVYRDGLPAGRGSVGDDLFEVRDVDAWIGRSNWIQDPLLWAHVDEFRIYTEALSDSEVLQTHLQGPDRP